MFNLKTKRAGLAVCVFVTLLSAVFVLTFLCFDKWNGPKPLPKGFILGANYPWHRYGQDFGENAWGHSGVSDQKNRQEVEADFAYLQASGVTRVRWFLFCDGRAGFKYDTRGKVTGLDDFVFKDIDAALEIAARHNVHIIFVLFDFHLLKTRDTVDGVQVGGRAALVENGEYRDSLFEKALLPVLERYGHEKQIIVWEVINEPEWAMQLGPLSSMSIRFLNRMHAVRAMDSVPGATMAEFISQVAQLVHAHTRQWVTVGSASPKYLNLWANCSLDFLEVHYYGALLPWLVQPVQSFDVRVPVLVGEFPSSKKLPDFLDTFLMDGYSGAFVWSLNATDRYSNFRGLSNVWQRWRNQHERELAP